LGVAAAAAWLPVEAGAANIGLVDGLWVMKKVDEVYEGDDVQEDLHLSMDRTGVKAGRPRNLEVHWLKKARGADDQLLVYFTAPTYAAGVTLSMTIKPYQDDDRWLYFPESASVRRVTASDEHSNFMGTDFTYYDLSEREPDEENHTLLRVEELKGAVCYVVETTPKEKNLPPNAYSRKITWVDKDRFIKLRIQYHNMAGKFFKQYDADRWEKIDGIWTPMLLVMEDVAVGHKTVIERSRVRYNQRVAGAFFEPQNVNGIAYADGKFAVIPPEKRRMADPRDRAINPGLKKIPLPGQQ
jgi:hypothetical protein